MDGHRDALPGLVLPEGSAILAAHPDDEIIGAGLLLARSPGCAVVHLTDGAPANQRLWPEQVRDMTRSEYAACRRHESRVALLRAGVAADAIACLGAPDGGAVFDVARVALRLARIWSLTRPPAVVIHAYEGGHPDHDTAALAAHLGAAILRRDRVPAPALVEMTSYHAGAGRFVCGCFLAGGPDEQVFVPAPSDAARKQAMLDAYATQAVVLRVFDPSVAERFRPAPAYDFSRAPHPGPLWFEIQRWMGGDEWRDAAARGIDSAGLPGVTCL